MSVTGQKIRDTLRVEVRGHEISITAGGHYAMENDLLRKSSHSLSNRLNVYTQKRA